MATKNLYGSQSSTWAAFNVKSGERLGKSSFPSISQLAWVMIFRRKRNFFLTIFCLSSANEISCCQGLSVFIMSLCEVHTSVCLSNCTPLCWSVCLGSCCHYKCIKTVGNFTPIFFTVFRAILLLLFLIFISRVFYSFSLISCNFAPRQVALWVRFMHLADTAWGCLVCRCLCLSVCPSVRLSFPYTITNIYKCWNTLKTETVGKNNKSQRHIAVRQRGPTNLSAKENAQRKKEKKARAKSNNNNNGG